MYVGTVCLGILVPLIVFGTSYSFGLVMLPNVLLGKMGIAWCGTHHVKKPGIGTPHVKKPGMVRQTKMPESPYVQCSSTGTTRVARANERWRREHARDKE
jgi:hypothetical protein